MANVQKQFEEFDEKIKLRRLQENATLTEKRDRVLRTVREGLERLRKDGKTIPKFRTFNQGSYEIGVGVKPLDGDYDIDVGVAFELARGEHDPVAVKQWVLEAVEGHTTRVEMRRSCVTVFYQAAGEPVYHVDLAVYADGPQNGGKLYLARGKQNSAPENREWSVADPEGLTAAINNRFSGEDAKQFRRVVRAEKRWKDNCFPRAGHAAPRGIALALAAYHWFMPATRFVDGQLVRDDLQALRNLVATMLSNFGQRLVVRCPVEPGDDLCARMTDVQMGEFKAKLEALFKALRDAASDADPHTACKTLAREFGEDFPIPERQATARPQRRAITSSGSSG